MGDVLRLELPAIDTTEAALIGALLQQPAAVEGMPELRLSGREFAEPGYRAAWQLIEDMRERCEPVDAVGVYLAAQARGMGSLCTLQLLNDAAAIEAPPRLLAAHAARLRRAARIRELQRIGQQIAEAATDADAVRELLRHAAAELDAPEDRPRGLPVEWASDLGDEPAVPLQLIEGVLTVGGLSSINGQPNVGKSYIATAAAIAVSSGALWLGRRTSQAPALIVAAEGASSVRARLQAHARHTGRAFGPVGLMGGTLNLLEPSADADALIATARAIEDRHGQALGLLVVDTLARVMAGGDENTAVDMGRLIGALDRIRETTGAHVMLVHHMGKDASRGARGHSSLRAALDTEFEVTVDEALKLHQVKVTKQRDLASKGETFACKFVPVDLGVDQWGAPITACVVVDAEPASSEAKPRPMSAAEQAVMGYLVGHGAGARRAAVALALEAQGLSRASAYRAITGLLARGLLTETAGQVYAPKP